ncbi:hypothetical protein [Photobacterium nomapromontoriensis]|uniref:hypothetical protein n=1 Tax=Photobacterium nomapromontoriensis TaxID=2910237 RepID=UPI003D130C93
MARLSPKHHAALDILDYLHFYDVLTSVFINQQQVDSYNTVLSVVEGLLSEHAITGRQAEITRHYLLCGLEIILGQDDGHYQRLQAFHGEMSVSEEQVNKITQFNIQFSLALLSIIAEKNGVDRTLFLSSMDQLIANPDIALIPPVIRQRLVARCCSFQFPDSALQFYQQLIERDVMASQKYRPVLASGSDDAQTQAEYAFLRAGLVIEFEILRLSTHSMMAKNQQDQLVIELPQAHIPLEQRRNMATYYKHVIDIIFDPSASQSFILFNAAKPFDKHDIEIFLQNVSRLLNRKRLFNGTKGRWIGTLGALLVEKQKRLMPEQAIYCECDNAETASEHASQILKQLGFSTSARSLYLRHKAFKKQQYQQMRFYSLCTSGAPFAWNWDMEDTFYEMALAFDPNQKRKQQE